MAFMKVSTSVVRKKRDDAPVVNIHGTTVAPSSIEAESVQSKTVYFDTLRILLFGIEQ